MRESTPTPTPTTMIYVPPGEATAASTRVHTIAIIDDHVLVRDGMVGALRDRRDLAVVLVGDDPKAVLKFNPPPDLVLLDLDLDGDAVSPSDAAAMIDRGSRVLVVSALGLPCLVRDMVRAGVAGFVPKRDSWQSLLQAIDTVLRGEHWTSPDLAAMLANDDSPDRPCLGDRERRVLMLYASGLKMSSVAHQLGISPHTAKEYLDRVRDKYTAVGRPVGTKLDLYREAVRDGFINP
ncbi:MAG: response regulator transcription factor [Actinomycetes bacterium]